MTKLFPAINAPLSKEIVAAYEKLRAVVQPLSREVRLIAGNAGSVADLIAYQIGWGTLLIGWYEAGIRGKVPIMPGEGFTKWDYAGLAEHFYQKYHIDAYVQQEKVLEEVVKRIVEIVEREYSMGNLDKLGIWQWCTLSSGKQWPLSKWVRVNTVSPYVRATRLVKNLSRDSIC
jgi:hypothetical protein